MMRGKVWNPQRLLTEEMFGMVLAWFLLGSCLESLQMLSAARGVNVM